MSLRRKGLGLGALVLAQVIACKPESARRADRAAKDLVEKRVELVAAAKKLPDTPLAEGAKAVLVEAGELARAAYEFEQQKSRRIAALFMARDLTATHAALIGVLARDSPITDAGRGEVNEKLTRLLRRLDETSNMIEGLEHVTIDAWEDRNAAATDAMKRLDDARTDAWEALEEAPHIDPNAS
jgi:hypothetical protein